MDELVVCFYGEDAFFIKSKIQQLLKKHNVDEFNYTTYDLDEVPLSEAISDAQTIPFMSDMKVIVLKNAFFLTRQKPKKSSPEHNIAYLENYLENPTESTLLIISVPTAALDKRQKVVKKLQADFKVIECKLKGPQDLANWAKRQLSNAGLTIEPSALDLLIKRIQHSTEFAYLELKKLLMYAKDLETIDKDIVEKLITRNVEDNVYELTNAILAQQQRRALEIYHDLILHSEEPLRILGIIIQKYREILHVKTLLEQGLKQDDIQQHFNVKSGRAYYMVQNAKSVMKETVTKHLETLETLDYYIKSGRMDKKHAVEMFIMGT